MVALGPGVFKLTIPSGAPGVEVDYSCLVNSLTLTTDIAVGDSTFKLCGTEIPGTLTPTGTLAGNVDQDTDVPTGGMFQACSEYWGAVAPFTFEPSTTAGLEASGSVLLTPLTFGGDAYGEAMVSDFSFQTVGDITYAQGGAPGWVQTMSPKQGVPVVVAAAADDELAGAPAGTVTRRRVRSGA